MIQGSGRKGRVMSTEQPHIWRVIHEEGVSYDGEISPQDWVFVQLSCGFRQILRELKGCPLAVFLDIALHMDENDQAKVGLRTIADETGYSLTSVQGAIAKLNRWIAPVTGPRGHRTAYQIRGWATRQRRKSVPLSNTLSKGSVIPAEQSVLPLPESVPQAVAHDEELSKDIVVVVPTLNAQKINRLKNLLASYGIYEPALSQLAQDSLELEAVYAWMLYANDQEWSEQQRTGYVINRCRERVKPPLLYVELAQIYSPAPAAKGGCYKRQEHEEAR